MTELEKAHYAARVFAEKKYKGASLWVVEETVKHRTAYGQVTSALTRLQQEIGIDNADQTFIRVVGEFSFTNSYQAQEAYLIALGLERAQE
ncbi:MAG: hypothetical protein KME21_30655 [Desmonostoc vinosum HA7617-LM4]|jgi:hypothetical protein|nr:hypothetical protein [Desmonostoc vinosum HA7617-LM4]